MNLNTAIFEPERYNKIFNRLWTETLFPTSFFREEALLETDPAKKVGLVLLEKILSLDVDEENGSFMRFHFFELSHLTKEDEELLKQMLEMDSHPCIKSRIADVLFERTGQFQYVPIALKAYLEMPILDHGWNLFLDNAWCRAFFLSKREKNYRKQIKKKFSDFLERCNKNDVFIVLWAVLNIFDVRELQSQEKAYVHCLEIIRHFLPNLSPMMYDSFISVIDKLANGNQKLSDSLYEDILNGVYNSLQRKISKNFFVESVRIDDGLQFFHKLSKRKKETWREKQQELLLKVRDLRVKAVENNEFTRIPNPPDVERMKMIEEKVKNTPTNSLLKTLLKKGHFSKGNLEALMNVASDEAKHNGFVMLGCRMRELDGNLKITATNLDSRKDFSGTEYFLKKQFLKNAQRETVECINPILAELQQRAPFDFKEIASILTQESTVLEKRNLSPFCKGIFYGLNGDVYTAMHLMIPHFENQIREILKSKGLVVSGRDRNDGTDYDLGLDSLLALDGAKEILGVANHFRIEALFCGNAGWNLRNLIAHGLVDENEHNMDLLQFAWLTIIDFLLSYKKE